ncbi:MAG: hypothetical protein IPH72_17875 [Sandaracinaceae bacterium]|nr:hypothetical protein [Sandaracinaceae bacterium]
MRSSPSPRPGLRLLSHGLVAVTSLLAACDDPTRYVPPVHPMVQASETLAAPGHSLEERIAALVAGTSPQHEPTFEPLVGHLDAGRAAEFQLTLRGTYCYIMAGAGEDSIEELDLELIDDQDVLLLLDRDPSRMATLGIRDAICPMRPEAYRLRVTATRGQGAFEVRVFQASNL